MEGRNFEMPQPAYQKLKIQKYSCSASVKHPV